MTKSPEMLYRAALKTVKRGAKRTSRQREACMLLSPTVARKYACFVLKAPWLLAEPVIFKDVAETWQYVTRVSYRRRYKAAEPTLAQNPAYAALYLIDTSYKRTRTMKKGGEKVRNTFLNLDSREFWEDAYGYSQLSSDPILRLFWEAFREICEYRAALNKYTADQDAFGKFHPREYTEKHYPRMPRETMISHLAGRLELPYPQRWATTEYRYVPHACVMAGGPSGFTPDMIAAVRKHACALIEAGLY